MDDTSKDMKQHADDGIKLLDNLKQQDTPEKLTPPKSPRSGESRRPSKDEYKDDIREKEKQDKRKEHSKMQKKKKSLQFLFNRSDL